MNEAKNSTPKPARNAAWTKTAMKTIEKIKTYETNITPLKLLGKRLNLKQSTCIKFDIYPILNFLLQSVEYCKDLLTIPRATQFEISLPRTPN